MGVRGLVLGGGGITGIAWEFGLLKGLGEAGLDLSTADVVLGTSAGSVVGSLMLSKPLTELTDDPARLSDPELGGTFAVAEMIRSAPGMVRPGTPLQRRRRVGRAAARAHPFGGDRRVELIRKHVDLDDWPPGALKISAMNAETGEIRLFDRESGADLVRVIAASCAVPFVWPPVVIDNVPYFDGGIRSPTNADLLTGADTVIALAPITMPLARYHNVRTQLARAGSERHRVVSPDDQARRVIGHRVLDPRRAVEAGLAGERQGRRVAERLAALWEA